MAVPTSTTARMGYIGFATVFGLPVRFSSSNLGLNQDIVPSDMVDGGADRVIYRQSVIQAEGDIAFPIILDDRFEFLDNIWKFAVDRKRNTDLNNRGELVNRGDVILRYSAKDSSGEGGTYKFTKCKGDT